MTYAIFHMKYGICRRRLLSLVDLGEYFALPGSLSFSGCGSGRRLASDDDYRAVVLVRLVSGLRAIEDAMAERGDFGAAEFLGQGFDLTDAFVAAVSNLGEHAVGVDHQLVAGRERDGRFGECGSGQRADRAASDGQLLMADNLRALRLAHLDHRQMARVDVSQLLAFPSGERARKRSATIVFLQQVIVQLFQNLRQVCFAADYSAQALVQIGGLAEGLEAPSAEITHRDQRADRRLEDVEVIAAGLCPSAVFRGDPYLRHVDDRRRQEELMRLLNQVKLCLAGAEFESLLDRFAGYVDRQVFRFARPRYEDECSRQQQRDTEQGRASAP